MAESDNAPDQATPNPSDLHDQIGDAAEQGDEIELRALLAQGEYHGLPQRIVDLSLGRAIEGNQAGCVRLLMKEYGAKTDCDTVCLAVEFVVSTDVWQALLDGGWDPNRVDFPNDPAIFNFLTDSPDNSMLAFFISHGASVELRSSRTGLSAISLVAGYRPVSVLRALLERSGYTSGDKLDRCNGVHEAAGNRDEDRTEALAMLVDEFGADVNALSTYTAQGRLPSRFHRAETRPLHKAVASGRREHVRFLLDRGARVTERDADGQVVGMSADFYTEGWSAVEEWFAEKGLEVPSAGRGRGEEQNIPQSEERR